MILSQCMKFKSREEEKRKILEKRLNITINELPAKNRKRKLLVLVNPNSGKGNSIKIWNNSQKYFEQANVETTVIITKRPKHAIEISQKISVDDYDGIIGCSGDGILHEVINTLLQRKERDIFLNRLAFGSLPGGTGNGLMKNICYHCGEDADINNMIYYILKGNTKKIDLIEAESFNKPEKIYLFLNLMYGILGDTDLEGEFLRFLGHVRDDLYGAFRWLFLRKYNTTLYYLPEDSQVDLNTLPTIKENIKDDDTRFIKETDIYTTLNIGNSKYISTSMSPFPKSKIDDGFAGIMYMKNSDSTKMDLFNFLTDWLRDGERLYEQDGTLRKCIHYFKTKFLRIIPKADLNDPDDVNLDCNIKRFYSIDGERYPIEPIQLKVLSNFLPVYSGME